MKKRILHRWIPVLVGGLLATGAASVFASFQSVAISTLSAGVSFGASVHVIIPTLPPSVFFGKDIVIPVEIDGNGQQLNLSDINASMIYQLYDAGNNRLGDQVTVPITLQTKPGSPDTILGSAIVPTQNLQLLPNDGQIQYYFLINVGTQQIFVRSPQSPFAVQFVNSMSFPVSPSGSLAVVPDPEYPDGKTSVAFPSGALSTPGTLVVTQLNPLTQPTGPLGLNPFLVYDMELQNTTLLTEAQLTLTYPTNPNGSLIGSNASAGDLAPYWLQSPTLWSLLSAPQLNSVEHTITTITTHFSTFGLFVSGPVGAADLRPAQRIITPNGDGINDTVVFSGVTATDDVKIFDVRGRRMRTMGGPQPVWDGRDDGGRIVESGVYIYQYTSNGTRVSGVIMVAK